MTSQYACAHRWQQTPTSSICTAVPKSLFPVLFRWCLGTSCRSWLLGAKVQRNTETAKKSSLNQRKRKDFPEIRWLLITLFLSRNSAKINHIYSFWLNFKGYYPKLFSDFGDASPKQLFATKTSYHSRTPLREHIQIRDFSASPKSPLSKSQNALFIGVSEDWHFAKC